MNYDEREHVYNSKRKLKHITLEKGNKVEECSTMAKENWIGKILGNKMKEGKLEEKYTYQYDDKGNHCLISEFSISPNILKNP